MTTNEQISCEFYNPLNANGDPPKLDQSWNFKNVICNSSGTTTNELLELIQNPENNAKFYLSKQINYGDILITTFLMVFLIGFLLKFLMDLVIPKRVNFKK